MSLPSPTFLFLAMAGVCVLGLAVKYLSERRSNDQSESQNLLPKATISEMPDILIFRSLRNTDQPVASYVWRAWLISSIPSLVIVTIVVIALGLQPFRAREPEESLIFEVFGIVLLSPWVETFLMWPIFAILKRFTQNILRLALGSALIWGAFHSLATPMWGLSAFWPFFVFSLCFLEWEKKSKAEAIIVTALVHMCQNAPPELAGLIHLISQG